ncbi:uncharacterized protein si:ch211-269k10.4 isoform X2 [Synchiropus splendidus]|uniref:uncharacterized protein si:ch211-269k10.4 isoform X2 n=1 Tax=Synchiropus splendidus TaxID=270530 RepID=UPI00237E2AD1|nr:uncharacterized protein si:ch211-269k10.4 isoform X2 [Synchiropus splendidus]
MACAVADMNIHLLEAEHRRPRGPTVARYEAAHMVPDARRPLHNLQSKPTAVLGGMQISGGFLSVGIGLMLAITQEIGASLITLFRVAHLTGLMFIFAGYVSNQLLRHPGLLHVSVLLNLICVVVSMAAAALMTADLVLARLPPPFLQMEILELGVLTLDALMSALLGWWFYKEKKSKASRPGGRS